MINTKNPIKNAPTRAENPSAPENNMSYIVYHLSLYKLLQANLEELQKRMR